MRVLLNITGCYWLLFTTGAEGMLLQNYLLTAGAAVPGRAAGLWVPLTARHHRSLAPKKLPVLRSLMKDHIRARKETPFLSPKHFSTFLY